MAVHLAACKREMLRRSKLLSLTGFLWPNCNMLLTGSIGRHPGKVAKSCAGRAHNRSLCGFARQNAST